LNYQPIELELNKVAKSPGIIACALVAIDTGMICLATSCENQFEVMAEGARDYWVLHHRNGKIFNAIGAVKNIYVQHAKGTICIQACGEKMLLITLADASKLYWNDWPSITISLRNAIHQSEIVS
jgi:predicted regulator of Ras-like GTPase activity (Roadblock/LC7/MglB family)